MQYIAGVSISLFVAALLANKKDKAQSDLYLMSWMLLNALHLSVHYTFTIGLFTDYPFLFGILTPLPLLHGVFLYLYVAAMTNQLPAKKYVNWLHAIPVVLVFIYLLLYFFFIPTEEQVKTLDNKGADHQFFVVALNLATMISGVIYVGWSILLLRKHKKNILNSFSGLEKVNLRWLWFLIIGLAILWTVVILAKQENHVFTVAVVFVILTGYFGIQQVDIFRNREKEQQTDKSLSDEKEKYAKSGLSEDASQDLYAKLISLMEEQSAYKKQELSIGELADMLDIHPNYLSQVINDKAGQSFYDFINTYRVEAFKKLIASPESKQFTLLSMAYDCGFNSKSSFNRYFKKATNHTPSQYVKSLQNAETS